ncbi:High-affinity branched-chain amino acid transport ATP-binding protein LivF [Pseudovibrio sp. Ad37]|uniref:ABC transporter ATP-binding protein n=2 Tax=unclassified Pseudovibrio TaxID=2627060 RepID=UPI0007AE4710|nr:MULTISPECIES: ABC transporter ATP-binding protein [unclassified Pseudovibrio]KZL24423.1 High-affinity branched-chain amino acid transport ATP-binding protein LivF [Pseudovibrio sp. Ad37]KZL27444.1 High-affinity branched-chain amino acid transport ATP-binding protein LivF [Pseudovibrio sp. WM33]
MPDPILSIQNLTAGYGATPIIHCVDLCVHLKGIVVIVGPNGAGKSTLLKSVFALNKYFSGSVEFMGQSIVGVKTADLVPMGISAVPQTSNVFANLTVRENLQVGTYAAPPKNPAATLDMILTLFPDLREKLNQPAGQLSGGQRQMVAIGRAMMSDPKLLLLDEPTAGLSPAYLERIFDLIQQIREAGISVLLVEQNAKQALRIADMGYVLVNGKNGYTDTGKNLLANDEVRHAFLGGGLPA